MWNVCALFSSVWKQSSRSKYVAAFSSPARMQYHVKLIGKHASVIFISKSHSRPAHTAKLHAQCQVHFPKRNEIGGGIFYLHFPSAALPKDLSPVRGAKINCAALELINKKFPNLPQ